jgi:hypothetical protein
MKKLFIILVLVLFASCNSCENPVEPITDYGVIDTRGSLVYQNGNVELVGESIGNLTYSGNVYIHIITMSTNTNITKLYINVAPNDILTTNFNINLSGETALVYDITTFSNKVFGYKFAR